MRHRANFRDDFRATCVRRMSDEVIAIAASVDTALNISEIDRLVHEHGVPVENLYRSAVRFYRDMETKGEFSIPYEVRLKFMAYSKQVKYGTYTEDAAEAGFFDFTGFDRHKVQFGDL
ncbi:hypothetical protein L596_011258 [Steinernema carpocapsae]|uniref:Uncharacterized protein n=1 Tax=Steinernema carpocapsae TaxID=34508 RepID=A0A4U5NUA4_STECR|nr:hypothetical protein L596_011258 [Steinernema carpocapsae]